MQTIAYSFLYLTHYSDDLPTMKSDNVFKHFARSPKEHMMATATRTAMTKEHKAALAQGRREGAAVRRYLEAIAATRGKRGRKRTPDSVQRRMKAIDTQLETCDALQALLLKQERKDLEAEVKRLSTRVDMKALEKEFIEAAGPYGQRKGIDYSTWRDAGVEPSVLAKAGIKRTRRA